MQPAFAGCSSFVEKQPANVFRMSDSLPSYLGLTVKGLGSHRLGTISAVSATLAMRTKLAKVYIISVAAILFMTAAAKLFSLVAYYHTFRSRDPLLYLRSDILVSIVSVLEIGVATFLLSANRTGSKFWAIIWISSLFLIYRVGLWQIGYKGTCPCMGTPNSWLMLLKPIHMDLVMKGCLVYMLFFSLAFLLIGIAHRGSHS